MKTLSLILAMTAGLFAPVMALAKVQTETINYKDGNIPLEGYLAYDDSRGGKRPVVLIVHEWTGLGPYVKRRAEQIANLGYVAFAIDMYGKGIRPKTPEEAAKQAGIYRQDRALMRSRALAGLAAIQTIPFVDLKRVAAIGYCFGGGVALEMARGGAPLVGVASFHGNLDTPHPEKTRNLKAKILVLHGAEDPHVTPEQVAAFQKEMRGAKADWEINIYSNAVHSFTNPDSGNDSSKGVAYNKEADERSWEALTEFLKEVFESPKN